ESFGKTDGFTYSIRKDGTSFIVKYSGEGGDIVIPSEFEGKTMTSIYESAFSDCTLLTSVTIPDSVTNIGNNAFSGCTGLTSVTIPDSVTSIGDYAFSGCSGLTNVEIGKGVSSIGYSAFSGCEALERVDISDLAAWCAISFGDNPLKYAHALYLNGELLTDLVIPDGVTSVGRTAFCGLEDLVRVTAPDSVTYVNASAFKDCASVEEVYFGSGIQAIRDSAFDGCTAIKRVYYPGTELEWARKVFVGDHNEYLRNAEFVFGYHAPVPEYVAEKAATCTENGNTGYWRCTVCGKYYSDAGCENEIDASSVVIPALGHDYVETVTAPTCTEQGYTTHMCSRCDDSYVDAYVDALGHAFGEWTVKITPTCTAKGAEERVCARCGEKETRETEALGHDYVETVTAPTCTEQGYTTHTCSRCDDSYIDAYVDALGHAFGEWTVKIAPTCTAKGVEERGCSRCGEKETRETEALGHDYVETVTAPTCTEQGYTTHTCKVCGDAYVDSEVAALGHDYGADGNAEKCSRCGEKNPDYKPPVNFKDVKAGAYYADAVAWAVAKGVTTGTSATTFSPDEGCTRGQVVTFLWRAAGSPEPVGAKNPFRDVKSDAYFYKAVLWAVENGITSGTSATTFSPDDVCTRGQIATFLWRANGKPSPTKTTNPFKDVKSGDYFCDAVLWAVEKGITLGTDAAHFSPSDTCTRGQVVTFLFRDANS
ncbi:MAG: leucine-rich repeat protein, partial [Clostridia bacterium]|nr:leucine-rich repeat protein [Clostridia bacterium]